MFSFFKPKKPTVVTPIFTDIHSHLLPGLDDGVKSWEESLEIISHFHKLGYTKLVTTPHIMSDYYRNTPEVIRAKLIELRDYLRHHNLAMEITAAAEYYLDEEFLRLVAEDKELLTFGTSRFLLFETNYLNEPYQLNDFIFKITTKGYKPILAHPERYHYLLNNFEKLEDLRNRGVLFQLNALSLIGYYSNPIRKTAEGLIEKGWVELLGSDCHTVQQIQLMKEVKKTKYYNKVLALPLLNNSL